MQIIRNKDAFLETRWHESLEQQEMSVMDNNNEWPREAEIIRKSLELDIHTCDENTEI